MWKVCFFTFKIVILVKNFTNDLLLRLRCPFMTEGHHYNRPRRFTNVMSNPRPYAVHENMWHRQQYHSELRRMYMSPSYLEAPDVPSMNQLRGRHHPALSGAFPPSIPPHHTSSAHNYSNNSHLDDRLNNNLNNEACGGAAPPTGLPMSGHHRYAAAALANNVSNLMERERNGEHARYRRASPMGQNGEGHG